MDRESVFVLQHVARSGRGDEDTKFIGVYSTADNARAAAGRLRRRPGFRDDPDGFCIDEYEVDGDHWTEGFGVESSEA